MSTAKQNDRTRDLLRPLRRVLAASERTDGGRRSTKVLDARSGERSDRVRMSYLRGPIGFARRRPERSRVAMRAEAKHENRSTPACVVLGNVDVAYAI